MEKVHLVRIWSDPTQGLALIFGWIVDDPYWLLLISTAKWMFVVCELVCFQGTLHIILVDILDTLELILFVAISLTFSFCNIVASKVLEEFDKCVVRHVLTCVDEALSLLLDVVFLVFLVVFVESLVLHRRSMSIGI